MPKKVVTLDRGVAWTPELKAEVWSWRGHTNPEFQREELEHVKDVRACFEKRRQYMGYDSHLRPFFDAGLGRVDPAIKPMMQAALQARDETDMPSRLDADTEIAFVALEIQPMFVSLLGRQGGTRVRHAHARPMSRVLDER